MAESDKPFVCIKGRWSIKIQPRGAEGWKFTALWFLPFLIIMAIFLLAMRAHPSPAQAATYTTLHLVAVGIWVWRMIVWMKARSEVIDIDELLELKRQQDEANRRKGR